MGITHYLEDDWDDAGCGMFICISPPFLTFDRCGEVRGVFHLSHTVDKKKQVFQMCASGSNHLCQLHDTDGLRFDWFLFDSSTIYGMTMA